MIDSAPKIVDLAVDANKHFVQMPAPMRPSTQMTRPLATDLGREDPGAERLAAVLGIQQASVALYSPLLLPLGLELGGFIFLALGLAPRRREDDIVTNGNEVASEISDPVAIARLQRLQRPSVAAPLTISLACNVTIRPLHSALRRPKFPSTRRAWKPGCGRHRRNRNGQASIRMPSQRKWMPEIQPAGRSRRGIC